MRKYNLNTCQIYVHFVGIICEISIMHGYEQYKDIYLETVSEGREYTTLSVILILKTVKYVPDICILARIYLGCSVA